MTSPCGAKLIADLGQRGPRIAGARAPMRDERGPRRTRFVAADIPKAVNNLASSGTTNRGFQVLPFGRALTTRVNTANAAYNRGGKLGGPLDRS